MQVGFTGDMSRGSLAIILFCSTVQIGLIINAKKNA